MSLPVLHRNDDPESKSQPTKPRVFVVFNRGKIQFSHYKKGTNVKIKDKKYYVNMSENGEHKKEVIPVYGEYHPDYYMPKPADGWMGEIFSGGLIGIGFPGVHLEGRNTRDMDRYCKQQNFIPVHSREGTYDKSQFDCCNGWLWEVLHNFLGFQDLKNFKLEEKGFEAWKKRQEKILEVTLKETKPDDIIWIHDYQHILFPDMLREKRPNQPIGFFLHTPFPLLDNLKQTKYAKALVKGMLGADNISFHISVYRENFFKAVKHYFPEAKINIEDNTISLENRSIKVGVTPIGLNYEYHAKKFETPKVPTLEYDKKEKKQFEHTWSDDTLKAKNLQYEVHQSLRQIIEIVKSKNKKLILSMSRLDPPKGILELLDAVEVMAQRKKDKGEEIDFSLILQVIPSREDVPWYANFFKEIKEKEKALNEKYPGLVQPIYKGAPYETYKYLQVICDVGATVTQIDGHNLVGVETQAAQESQATKARFVISKATGVAHPLTVALNKRNSEILDTICPEAKEAVKSLNGSTKTINNLIAEYATPLDLVDNPKDKNEVADALSAALDMSPEQAEREWKQIRTVLKKDLKLSDWKKQNLEGIKQANLANLRNKYKKVPYFNALVEKLIKGDTLVFEAGVTSDKTSKQHIVALKERFPDQITIETSKLQVLSQAVGVGCKFAKKTGKKVTQFSKHHHDAAVVIGAGVVAGLTLLGIKLWQDRQKPKQAKQKTPRNKTETAHFAKQTASMSR